MTFISKRETKSLTTLILAALTVSLIPIIMPTPLVSAANGTTIKVLPSLNTFYANTTLPGKDFIVNATVANVTDLQNWQIRLTWNSSLLSYVNITLPSDNVFAASGKSNIIGGPIVGAGSVTYGVTYINGDPGTPQYWTFNGTGTLAQLALRILAPPSYPATCNLAFADILSETFLINGQGYDIVFAVEDGTYSYIDQLAVTLNPPGPVLVDPGGTAAFTATAQNGPLPYKYQWYLKYPNGTEIEDTGAENQTSWTTPPITLFGEHQAIVRVADRANAKASASAIVKLTGGPVLFIDPSRIVDPSLIPGETFNVSLAIANASTLHSWSANLLYNNTILMVTAVIEGDFMQSFGSTTFTFTTENGYNSTHGRVQMSCELASGEAEGDGELAIITFQVLEYGGTAIAITDADLRDSLDNPVPATTEDGYFNNVLLGKLAIDPPEVSGPEYLPGSTFTINVTLDDVENLKTCIFNLTYIPSIIQEINVITRHVSGQIPVKKLQIDDDAGYIWINLTYRNGITTYEPVPLMSVEFLVLSMGVSPINLTDTHLFDMDDQPITHEVYHGIFIGLIRDVALLDVTPDLNIAYQGWIVNISVTVKNKGNVTETFDVTIYYDANLGPIYTVVDLVPDEERTFTINWNTTNAPYCNNYTISATAGPVPFEFNLSDNELEDGKVKIRIMGDVNGDGVVDMRDISYEANAYGAKPGDPKWDFLADLNRDERIDLRDIGIACNNFMKHC